MKRKLLSMTIIAAMEIVHKVMINGTDNIPPLDPFFMEQLLDFESDQDKYKKYFVVLPIWWSKFNSALSFHTHRLHYWSTIHGSLTWQHLWSIQ